MTNLVHRTPQINTIQQLIPLSTLDVNGVTSSLDMGTSKVYHHIALLNTGSSIADATTVLLQESPDNINWFPITQFNIIAAPNAIMQLAFTRQYRYIRAVTSVVSAGAQSEVTAITEGPVLVTSTGHGSTVDLGSYVGEVQAIQQVGAVVSVTLTGSIQESSDDSTYTVIAGSAGLFTAVTLANKIQKIRFTNTKRYLRWNATVSGTSALVAVSISYKPIVVPITILVLS